MDKMQDLQATLELDRDAWDSEPEDESESDESGSSYRSMSDLEVYNDKLDLGALISPNEKLVILLVEGSTNGLDSQSCVPKDSTAAVSNSIQPGALAATSLLHAFKDKFAAGSFTWFFKLAVELRASTGPAVGLNSAGTKWLRVVPEFLPDAVITSATSAGGLICFLLNSDVPPRLVLVNPVSGTWQPLPDPPLEDVHFVSMTYKESENAYRLFLTSHQDVLDYAERDKFVDYKVYDDSGEEPGEGFLCLTCCVYDSGRGTWATAKHIVPIDFSYILGAITSYDSWNYWLAESQLYGHTVICYNDEQTMWLRLHIPQCSLVTRHSGHWSNPYISCNLFELSGEIFLAAEVHNDDGKAGVCIRIWKLSQQAEIWDVALSIQSESYLKLLPRHYRGFLFAAHGECIWLVARGTPASLLYDLSSSSLYPFPACPFEVDYTEQSECFRPTAIAHAFHPRFDNPELSFSKPAEVLTTDHNSLWQ